jgi:hypothetical protein
MRMTTASLLWRHRPDSDYDIALELKPKKRGHDWAFGDYVFLCDEWKAEIKALINSDISLVAFRGDLEGRFDPRDQGIMLWPCPPGREPVRACE